MIEKIKNVLFYGGFSKSDFNRVKHKIKKDNLTMVTVLSFFATILISATFFSSFKSEGIEQNRFVYILGIIMSLSILFTSVTVAKKYPKIRTYLVFISYITYFMYGILIGTITDPSGKTVTFVVLLVYLPVLFIDRPMNFICISSIHLILFIVLCLMNKTGPVLTVDILDALTYGILGAASGAVINHRQIKSYILEEENKEINAKLQKANEELEHLSRIDQLTDMRNRNAYESDRDSIPDLCNHSLTCIYIDVNGLHELNNEKGHELGDKMLQHIAIEVKYAFGEDLTYRIGGDEFIAFVPDKKSEEIDLLIKQLVEKIERRNYHVAIGYEFSQIIHIRLHDSNLHDLIETAEDKMKENKEQYYKKIGKRHMRNSH